MGKLQKRLKPVYWMLKEIFWRSFVALLVLAYGLIQLWQTFAPMLPENWGIIRRINVQWYVWTIIFLVVLIIYIIAQTYRLSAHRFELSIELQFSTKSPRKSYGRYLGLKIRNNSPKTIEACGIKLLDIAPINNDEWKPSPLVKRNDLLRWSDWMSPANYEFTFGKLDIKSGHEVIANIAFTQPNSTRKNILTIDLQTKDYKIDMPRGYFVIQLEINGVYSGGRFQLPIWLAFNYLGRTSIEEIKPINLDLYDRRIESISVEHDGKFKVIKGGMG